MESLKEQFYDNPELGEYSLEDFNNRKMGKSREEDVYVKAKVGTRDTMLYSTEICRVLGKIKSSSLAEEKFEVISEEEVLNRMPKKAVDRLAVPSLKGEYLELLEFEEAEQDKNGNYNLTKGNYPTIPVEYVLDILDYNEAILELDVYD